MRRVLIIGGTGYLGQHLLQGLADTRESAPYALAFTYHSSPPPQILLDAIPQALAFHVDLRTGDGFDSISQKFGQVNLIFFLHLSNFVRLLINFEIRSFL